MRVIAGQKKGHKLLSLSGKRTRPTTDYVKEAIFSIIFDCSDLRVLDLFAGSGALGFEALSRGARSLELVDRSEKAVQIVRKNISKLQYEDKARIHKQKADTFIKTTTDKYDLVLLDPPYDNDYVNPSLEAIYDADILENEGIIVVEHSHQESIKPEWLPKIVKQKRYGDTTVTILKR